MKDRCYGCHCLTCRWKGAGSLCHYNNGGPESGRCSICASRNLAEGEYKNPMSLNRFKHDSWECKGYEKRYGADEK